MMQADKKRGKTERRNYIYWKMETLVSFLSSYFDKPVLRLTATGIQKEEQYYCDTKFSIFFGLPVPDRLRDISDESATCVTNCTANIWCSHDGVERDDFHCCYSMTGRSCYPMSPASIASPSRRAPLYQLLWGDLLVRREREG